MSPIEFLFPQLLGHFDCESARNAAMMDLRHRILPPRFLSENPKEAGFCLWLLHPDPASRPSSRYSKLLGFMQIIKFVIGCVNWTWDLYGLFQV